MAAVVLAVIISWESELLACEHVTEVSFAVPWAADSATTTGFATPNTERLRFIETWAVFAVVPVGP